MTLVHKDDAHGIAAATHGRILHGFNAFLTNGPSLANAQPNGTKTAAISNATASEIRSFVDVPCGGGSSCSVDSLMNSLLAFLFDSIIAEVKDCADSYAHFCSNVNLDIVEQPLSNASTISAEHTFGRLAEIGYFRISASRACGSSSSLMEVKSALADMGGSLMTSGSFTMMSSSSLD